MSIGPLMGLGVGGGGAAATCLQVVLSWASTMGLG